MDATITLSALLLSCAPNVHAHTARALVQVESAANPYAIGVVGGTLIRQPRTRAEALATANALQANGWNFSAGLAQINARNFDRLGLSTATVFDPCANLQAMQAVLSECFERARAQVTASGAALRNALSCYYSGNFVAGYRDGYVQRVVRIAAATPHAPKEQP